MGFIKKILLVVGQINKKWSFTGWGKASRGSKGWGWGEKFFLVMQGRDEDLILRPRPAPPRPIAIPS